MTQDDIPELALDLHRTGRGAVLATVLETWGSALRAAGSQMVVDGAGQMMGAVSGGCVEAAVVLEAAEALVEGRPRVLTCGVSDDDAFTVGLACGGRIRVLVEPVAHLNQALAGLVAARAEGRAVALVTGLAGYDRALVAPGQERRLIGGCAPTGRGSRTGGSSPSTTRPCG